MKNDAQLKDDVLAELDWQPRVNSAHIEVNVNNHIVTLTGHVAHYTEKLAAQNAVRTVYGVKAVANEIDVTLSETNLHTDQDIAQAALNALKWDFEVPAEGIQVMVTNGYVTLEGTVRWHYQKEAAARCVQYLMGVRSVTNSIAIESATTSEDIKDKIEVAFRRNANIDARRVDVETYAGEVTLRGNVSSSKEQNEAIMTAWAAPGVTSVRNQMLITL